MKEPNSKIGLTLFNLRDYCKTKDELDETLRKVKEIGYQAVQVSGIGPISPEDVKELLDKYELYCCATHENMDAYEKNFEATVAKLKLWDCSFTALGSPGCTISNAEDVQSFIKRLTKVAKKFKAEGITFAYHNHHTEFVKFSDKTMLDEIYDNTTDDLYAELDVHWVQRGGGNPVEWLYKMKGRTSVIHYKDMALDFGNGLFEATPVFAEIGEGNMDWPGIIKACEDTDVRWYVVEQDQKSGDRDIFESMKISYDNMIKMGIK